jgi:hypothetical protein
MTSGKYRNDLRRLTCQMRSEPNIEFQLRFNSMPDGSTRSYLLCVLNKDEAGENPAWAERIRKPNEMIVYCEPRGIGATAWQRTNPPNDVERSHALIGRTVDTGRVWDPDSAAKYLMQETRHPNNSRGISIRLAGSKNSSAIAA